LWGYIPFFVERVAHHKRCSEVGFAHCTLQVVVHGRSTPPQAIDNFPHNAAEYVVSAIADDTTNRCAQKTHKCTENHS